MNNIKVEILGVDTSKLPRLSASEQMEMLRRIKNGENELKEEFINANMRLVLSLIKKFNNRGENINDIFQVGIIGLIKAIDNFDIEQPVQFSTYAVPMIVGEVKRFLRDNSAFRVTRSLRDLAYVISQEKEKYIKEKNEEPTVDEICKLVNADKEDVILAIDSMISPMSIYDSVFNDGGDQIFLLDQLKNEKEDHPLPCAGRADRRHVRRPDLPEQHGGPVGSALFRGTVHPALFYRRGCARPDRWLRAGQYPDGLPAVGCCFWLPGYADRRIYCQASA